jgi:hypothetical protein
MRHAAAVLAAAALVLLAPARSLAQDEHDHMHMHEMPERFGTIHFPTSCRADQASAFERAVAMLHSFAYPQAAQAFADIAAKDPTCAMAQWGVAMSYFHTIWGPPTPQEFAAGKAAADKAVALEGNASPRERGLIGAIAAYYAGDGVPHATRVLAFESAMAEVATANPDDHEVMIFDALAMLAVAYNSPPDKTYARQKKAAAILNGLLPLEPDHPGIAHYMIHAFDYPELAQLAVPAARAYAKIAPSAPHALHMPSHIFTRLGMWHESIESNLASAAASRALMARTHPGATAYEGLHAMDYLEYAYLQTGQDAKARAILDTVTQVAHLDAPAFQAGYALAAVPARFALERRDWKTAATLWPQPASYPWEKFPYAAAMVHLARAVGAAHTGDVATARAATAQLDTIQAGLRGQKGFDWATQVEIQHREAQAWVAWAEQRKAEAVTLMRSAADLEDSTDKSPVTPGSLLPAREQLGDLLLEQGDAAAALKEYEASLAIAPARLNSYVGAAQAATRAGQPAKAKMYKDRLVAMCDGSLPDRVAAAGLTK